MNCKRLFGKCLEFFKCKKKRVVAVSTKPYRVKRKRVRKPEPSTLSYKRENHFDYIMNSYSNKNDKSIPQDVIETVRNNIDTEITTPYIVKRILRRHNLIKYYDHAYNIAQIINKGYDYEPLIKDCQEEEFRNMFRQIQEPFNRAINGTTRKNFLPYSYVLIKFCELKGYNHIKSQINILKSPQKLIYLDKIWKKICLDLGWKFIPSLDPDIRVDYD